MHEEKVIFFGSYDPKYPRNLLTRKALEKSGYRVLDCNDQNRGIKHYLKLINKFKKLTNSSKVIFIPVLGHFDVPLAWVLAKIYKKEIILDAFYSVYDTYIEDRKIASKASYKALRFYLYDLLTTRLSNKIILDTEENINYFIKKYKAKRSKFYELPVTADPQIFKYGHKKTRKRFLVGFYGSFMPLHGVEKILESMTLIKFSRINCILQGIGPGISDSRARIKTLSLKNNVRLLEKKIAYNQLPSFLSSVDLFLAGPFGDTEKAQRVLTAKTVEALSVGVPVVVRQNNATKRLLKNYRGQIIWVKTNKSEELARTIDKFFQSNTKINKNNFFQTSNLSYNTFQKKLIEIINKSEK